MVGVGVVVVYVLELAHGRWYVGASSERSFKQRMHAHFGGTGAVWTRAYAPVRISKVFVGGDHIVENAVTKRYMRRYGIDRVRGGSYCTLRLDMPTLAFLTAELAGGGDDGDSSVDVNLPLASASACTRTTRQCPAPTASTAS